MKKRFLAFALAMAMVLAMLPAARAGEENEASSSSESEAAPEFPVEVRDTIIEDAPKGVLSLTPGTTEMLFDMGLRQPRGGGKRLLRLAPGGGAKDPLRLSSFPGPGDDLSPSGGSGGVIGGPSGG